MDSYPSFSMTIGGEAVSAQSAFDVINPATEKVIAGAPDCSRAQLDAAVAAARAALPDWRARPMAERAAVIKAIGQALEAHVEDLARFLTSEQGKPLPAAKGDILGGAAWCSAVSAMEPPVTVNEDSPARLSQTRHVPIGVVGAIVPWNVPVLLAMWKIAPALLCGNTMVLKPSPYTPLTTLRIGEILRGIVPAGVLNIISGGERLGPWMTAHAGIDKITFTGSTQTGKAVMRGAADTLKRITLELGGNDAAIVLPDVDVGKVAKALFWGAFQNAGQVCVAAKRIYVHDDVYEPMLEAMTAVARAVRVGDGFEQGVQIGPVQNRAQYERVLGLLEMTRLAGHRCVEGADVPRGPGYFVPVTLVDNPPEDALIVTQEQFGPVLPLMRFCDVDDAVARANASPYGLAGSVWSADTDRAQQIAERLECGTVWINEVQHVTPHAVFAGHKQSGFGAENGLDGLLEYTNPQTIVVRRQ